jgi:hypothetical protein
MNYWEKRRERELLSRIETLEGDVLEYKVALDAILELQCTAFSLLGGLERRLNDVEGTRKGRA